MEEDKTVLCENDVENGQRLIKGSANSNWRLLRQDLKIQYKIPQVQLTAPKVGYKETICAEATARCRYKKQSGGQRQFSGKCRLHFHRPATVKKITYLKQP